MDTLMPDSLNFDLVLASPVGPLGLVLRGERVRRLCFLPAGTPCKEPGTAQALEVARQLGAYFQDPAQPLALPLDLGGTPFQQRVWDLLRGIPAGQTLTYGEAAALLGSGPRAVGGACRANPCPLLVPCHRIVGARGPGGFAGARHGAWLAIKSWLLEHEAVAGRPRP